MAHIPHSVHIIALTSAVTARENTSFAFLASGELTDTWPPPNSLARPIGRRRRAISYASSYFASPTVRRASST